MKCLLMVAAATLLLGACRCEPEPAPPPPVRSEVDGLSSSVTQVTRATVSARLEVGYLLEWTAAPGGTMEPSGTIRLTNVWFLEPLEPVDVHFWDASGKRIGEAPERVLLPEPFRQRSTPRHEMSFLVDAPAGATSLSVALGRSGLETERKALP